MGRAKALPPCVVFWTLVSLLSLAVLSMVILPWAGQLSRLVQQVETAETQLIQYRGLVAALPLLREELRAERNKDEHKAFYFDEATEELASAALQKLVQEQIRQSGAQLLSTQAITEKQDTGRPRIGIRAQFQGDTGQLIQITHALEAAKPVVLIEQISIRSLVPSLAPNRRGDRERFGQLMVRLDLAGYRLEQAQP